MTKREKDKTREIVVIKYSVQLKDKQRNDLVKKLKFWKWLERSRGEVFPKQRVPES